MSRTRKTEREDVVAFLPVREVHPGDVHAVLDELQEDLGTAAGRPDGAHDSGQTHPKHNHTNKKTIPICTVRYRTGFL
jgi:hypothetical protein